MPQTKRVRVYRANKKLFTLEPGNVAGFVVSTPAEKIHRTHGQIFRIDLAEKHYRSYASQTTYGKLGSNNNSQINHLANRNLFR